jgi:hypothetical protein
MVDYICRRCGYKTEKKSNILNHLNKQKICNAINEDIPREELINEINNRRTIAEKIYTCDYCDSKFGYSSNYYRHKRTCKSAQRITIDINELDNIINNKVKERISLLQRDTTLENIPDNTSDETFEYDGHIYIIHTREFYESNRNIYKIGRTSDINRRFKEYPKGSKLLFNIVVKNMNLVESKLIKELSDKMQRKLEYGNEYFEGSINEIIEIVNNIIKFN